jgi:hypothetical protein
MRPAVRRQRIVLHPALDLFSATFYWEFFCAAGCPTII